MIRVALADDQALVRAGFRALLDAEDGIAVVGEAGDGEDAVQLAKTLTPDVVLMDIRMPDLDGLAATRAVKQESPGTCVIIVTMHENPEYLLEAFKALDKLQPSSRDGLEYAVEKVQIPLAPLPPEEALKAEIAEMQNFIRRASAGDDAHQRFDLTNCRFGQAGCQSRTLRLSAGGRQHQREKCVRGFPHTLEGRRPRHPDFPAGQGGIRQAAVNEE